MATPRSNNKSGQRSEVELRRRSGLHQQRMFSEPSRKRPATLLVSSSGQQANNRLSMLQHNDNGRHNTLLLSANLVARK